MGQVLVFNDFSSWEAREPMILANISKLAGENLTIEKLHLPRLQILSRFLDQTWHMNSLIPISHLHIQTLT